MYRRIQYDRRYESFIRQMQWVWQIMVLGCKLLGVEFVGHNLFFDHWIQFASLGGFSKRDCLSLNIVWFSMVWTIRKRNCHIFQHKDENMQTSSKKIKLPIYGWLKSKYTTLIFNTMFGSFILTSPMLIIYLLEALLFRVYVITKLLLIDCISLWHVLAWKDFLLW